MYFWGSTRIRINTYCIIANLFTQLADVLKSLGDHDASLKAAKYLATVKQHIKKKRQHVSHGTLPTISPTKRRHGSLLSTLERTASKRNKMGSWPSLKQQKTLDTSLSYSSRAIFTSPLAMLSEESLASGSMIGRWDSVEDRFSQDSTLCFPYIYDCQAPTSQVMDDPQYIVVRRTHHFRREPSNHSSLLPRHYSDSELSRNYPEAETTTDYETVSNVSQLTYRPYSLSSSREGTLCQGSSLGSTLSDHEWADLTPSSYQGSEISEEEVDKEWEQWINLRDVK